jgi:hypothetical protein
LGIQLKVAQIRRKKKKMTRSEKKGVGRVINHKEEKTNETYDMI